MLHLHMVLEDSVVNAVIEDSEKSHISVFDTFTKQKAEATVSTQGLAAAVALAVGGDEMPGAERLYELAEEVMTYLPNGLRFIP